MDSRFTALMMQKSLVKWDDPSSIAKWRDGAITNSLKGVFEKMERFRTLYSPSIEWLLTNQKDWLKAREDLALLYTFTTDGCTEGGVR